MSDRDGEQGPPSPEERGGKPPEGGRPGPGEALARELWIEVRGGAEHFHLQGPRVPSGRVRQFIYGMSLPFHLGRVLLADPVARKRYLRVGLLQTVAALTLALTFMGSCREAAEEAGKRASRERAAAERQAEQLQRLTTVLDRHLDPEQAEAARRVLDARSGAVRSTDAGVTDRQVRTEVVADAGRPVRSREQRRAEAQARLDQRIRELEAAAQGSDAGVSFTDAITALALEAVRTSDDLDAADGRNAKDEDGDEAEDEAEDGDGDGGTAVAGGRDAPRGGDGDSARGDLELKWEGDFWTSKGFSLMDLTFWAALFAAMQIAQWVVIALSHEHHDAIARDASLLTGVKPEDDEIEPRIRVDMAWIRKKVKRRWRAVLLFAMGLPAMMLLTVPFLCMCIGAGFSILSTVWGAYWLAVFTAAKSGLAWEPPTEPHTPWFLRGWTWLTTNVPGLRWGVLRWYGAAWGRRTQEVIAPVATLDRHPWVFAGLTVVRFINAFPPMKFFLRPLIPVASAHLLAEEAALRAAQVPPPPEKPEIPEGETGA